MKKLTPLFLSIGLCALSLAPAAAPEAYAQRRAAAAAAPVVPATPAAAPAAKFRKSAAAVPNHYIVVFNESVADGHVNAAAEALVRAHGGTLGFTYENALRGFSVELNDAQAAALSRNPQVAFVEADVEVTGASTQTNAPWPLDRLDQREPVLNNSYNYATSGAGVNAYVIDGGIRLTHQEFGGRAVFAYDNVGDGRNGVDCNGHGTHVAGLIGGNTYGVAKGVKLHAVRVLNCSNQALASRIIAGVDWVTANHVKPAVANMSFFVGNGNDALDLAVRNSIATGITYVVAAGNLNRDASLHSPARVAEAITVAATDRNDSRATFSNFGAPVDVFAPGVEITSAHSLDDASTFMRSGTSSAAPHVAGLVARYLAARPGDQPDTVQQAIRNAATTGKVTNPGAGSPNLLAFAANTISDDFNDNTRDAQKWLTLATPDFNVAEQNGRLEITPAGTSTSYDNYYDGYYSATTVDLMDSRISVEGVSVPTLPNYGSYLFVSDGVNYLLFGVGGVYNNLVLQQSVGGVLEQTVLNYDAAAHRFWRIRHNRANDTVVFEASPDGQTWTALSTVPRKFQLSNLYTWLMVRQYAATSPTGTTVFDNLWHETNPTPAVLLADDFNDNVLDPQTWSVFDSAPPATVIEQNGRIEVSPAPNTAGWPGVYLPATFDFRDKTMQVEVQPATQTGSVWTCFKIYLDAESKNYLMFITGAGYDFYDATADGVLDRTYTPRDAGIRFWRFRHNSDTNTVSFDTSTDGVTWTTRKTVPVRFPIHSLWTFFGVGTGDTTNAAPGTATFDNFRFERYRPLFPQSDDFNDNARDVKKWHTLATPDFTVAEQNGRLEITPAATSTNYDGYWAATNFDLTDARISIQGVNIPTLPNYGSYLFLIDGNNYLLFGVGGVYDNLVLQQSAGGVLTQAVLNYDAAAHRFWRIRHNRAADTVNFEASPDGVTWTTLHTAPRKFALTNLQSVLMVRQYAATSPVGTTVFDNLRIERNEGGLAR
ncbi:MAG TPA: S8 family peptidase [Pyrinomonadaceae bacterium]|nr:S8 family peptidase [Pyrinomonadaceae bacterium]